MAVRHGTELAIFESCLDNQVINIGKSIRGYLREHSIDAKGGLTEEDLKALLAYLRGAFRTIPLERLPLKHGLALMSEESRQRLLSETGKRRLRKMPNKS